MNTEKPKRIKYRTKTVHTSVWSQRKVTRLVAKGWEVVSTYGGSLGTRQTVTLRRPK